MKTVIIDDEPRAHKVLESYIGRHPELKLVGTFLNAITGYNFLNSHEVDLIFLDITMPGIDGFALLRMLPKHPQVVFTTAHAEFALESYEYNALDYLKKPFSFQRFSKAVGRAADLLAPHSILKSIPEDIVLKIDGQLRNISFSDVLYFKSLGNYVKVITMNKTLITQVTTKELEDMLPKEMFIRIHKSYIVNLFKVEKITDDTLSLGVTELPIGKTFKKYVKSSTGAI